MGFQNKTKPRTRIHIHIYEIDNNSLQTFDTQPTFLYQNNRRLTVHLFANNFRIDFDHNQT